MARRVFSQTTERRKKENPYTKDPTQVTHMGIAEELSQGNGILDVLTHLLADVGGELGELTPNHVRILARVIENNACGKGKAISEPQKDADRRTVQGLLLWAENQESSRK